jgi:hypothetical protein
MRRIEKIEGIEKTMFVFCFATLCLMMVCTIPYDRLPTPTEPTDLPNSTATTIAPKGREERKKETCPRGLLDDQKKG